MKKVVSLALAVILSLGLLTVPALADDPQKGYSLGLSGENGTVKSYYLGSEVRPDGEASFYIFLNGKHALRQDIRNDRIDVKRKASAGSRAVDNVSIKYDGNGYAYVKVEFADPFVSTKEMDFTITLYLTANKSQITQSEIEITGTLENYVIYVDEYEDYVDMKAYPVVEAQAYNKSIQLYVGDGLSVYAKLFDGKRYYGRVTQNLTAADDSVLSKYPSIDTIYHLQTINLNSAGNYVRFDLNDKLYVYNADLQYIGTTNDKLPYSTKYYLSSAELDVNDITAGKDDIPNNSETENVPSGGDDTPPNYNKNPGTGR